MPCHPLLLALAVLLLLAPPRAAAQSAATLYALADQIDAILDARDFENAYWGALIVDLETGRTLYARNAENRFIPASTMKLYTTAAALDALGPDFRYETRLYANGAVRGGTLYGSLVVRGSGDPSFGSRQVSPDLTRTFRQWADSLLAQGIRRVTGPIVGDHSVFENEPYGEGWDWSNVVRAYGAESSGLQFNEGTVELTVRGTAPGQRAALSASPDYDYVTLVNQTTTSRGGGPQASVDRGLGDNVFTVSASVPAGRTHRQRVAVSNPSRFFVATLVGVLRQAGIQVDGEAITVDEWDTFPRYETMTRVATYRSPPLRAIINVTNSDSNNLYAEHLLRTVGAYGYRGREHAVGSVGAGAAAAEPFLRRIGVDPGTLRIADGSGLSRLNRLTPLCLVAILQAMHEHEDDAVREAFVRSLAVGGLTGTLRNRYASGRARGNVRAKTGFIRNVRTLSGYVTAANGHTIAFALLCNDYTVPTARVNRAQDAVVELLANLR
ncbi:MAG: D-alanyl-D-alanine carboxypeptidase/D-alanyl-D-alanine-endopeptidase [Rubricoccaceae bacterium]